MNWGFKNSKNSEYILDTAKRKYGTDNFHTLAPVILLKACSVASAKIKMKLPKFNVFIVAPTRQFKSKSTKDSMSMFQKSYYLKTGSDFTIFTLMKKHKEGKLKDKCIVINDGTVLFESKAKRAKDRLIGGLSELLADGEYVYSDRISDESIKGNFSMIMNMTLESYNKYEKKLLGSTYLERFATLFYALTEEEKTAFNLEAKRRILIKFDKIRYKSKNNVDFTVDDIKKLSDYAKEFSLLSLKSYQGTFDVLYSMVVSHAVINNRERLIDDDFVFLDLIKPYIECKSGNKSRIMILLKDGKGVKEICELLGKDFEQYKTQVYRVRNKAIERGLLYD